MDCIFCKIIAGDIPSKKIYEDDEILAFYDIEPKAPVHFLVIPKAHISGADAVTPDNSGVVAHIFETIPKLAKELGYDAGFGAGKFAEDNATFIVTEMVKRGMK